MNNISAEFLSNELKIHRNTWSNWKKTKPRLVELVLKGLNQESGAIEIQGNNNIIGSHNKIMINGNDICNELCSLLEKLPEHKQKKFFYKMMAEMYDELEK